MINTKLVDGHGGKNKAKIGNEGELSVVVHPHPPKNESIEPLPYSQFFTDNGEADGSNDMIVNGAVTPIDFYVSAKDNFDIYIKTINVALLKALAHFCIYRKRIAI